FDVSFLYLFVFFFSSRRRHTRSKRDWSSDVCSSDLPVQVVDAAHLLDHGPVEGRVVRDERVLADEGHHLRVELLPARSSRDRGRGDAVDAHVPGRELVMTLRGSDERGHLLDDLAVTDSREADGAERGTRGVRGLDVDSGEVESTGRSGGHGAEPRIRCRHSTVGLTVLTLAHQ